MSFGKMNSFIEIVSTAPVKDDEGFVTTGDVVVANVRAYFEQKNSTEKWTNLAQNSTVNALFRFRMIPNLTLTEKHVIICDGKRYHIFSVENVRGRNMYLEVWGMSIDGKS
ncbi:MAG: head-tail adaptor protein [Ruthenibacterium sp.]